MNISRLINWILGAYLIVCSIILFSNIFLYTSQNLNLNEILLPIIFTGIGFSIIGFQIPEKSKYFKLRKGFFISGMLSIVSWIFIFTYMGYKTTLLIIIGAFSFITSLIIILILLVIAISEK